MSANESPAELLERLAREREPVPAAPRSFRLAVSGGRNHAPAPWEMDAFRRALDELQPTELHHGDSSGVDRIVSAWVRREYPALTIIAHSADWDAHGKAAGPIRNREMMSRCEALIAFPGGRGTQNCVLVARQQGRRVVFIQDISV